METLNTEGENKAVQVANEIAIHPPSLRGLPVPAEIVEPPNMSDFLDYRKYLASYYLYRRKLTVRAIRQYNYAVFSAAADIKSPNYLKMIIEGKRNLSDDMILKFAKALNLNKELTDEFRLLVLFSQASDPAERNIHLKEINEHRVRCKIRSGEIDQKTWDKVPSWISWILFSMIDQEGVQFKASQMKDLLRGMASQDEISAAIKALVASGEVFHDEAAGTLIRAQTSTETADDIPVALVRKLQAELMYLGMESLFRDPATEREFGSLTMSLTKQEFEEMKFHLRKLRKQTQKDNSVRRMSTKGERVYQLNLQLFPVTDKA